MDAHDRSQDIDYGIPGASARREHARRRANRRDRAHKKHPRIGRALTALAGEPVHERAWVRGALGEERVAASLQKHVNQNVIVLHDRRIPGSRANIDHIAIGRSGVWVIDAKNYRGKVSVAKPLLGKPKLVIGGRDRTRLVDALAGQVALVSAVVSETASGVPVHGALCFLGADLPLVRSLQLQGVRLSYPRALAKRISRSGPVEAARVHDLAVALSQRFPPA